jgi:hypothetical protein
MFALLKNLYPERTGLINRWHYFFLAFLDPESHSLDSGNPYSPSCQNSHAMKVLIVLTFTPLRLPCRQAILPRRILRENWGSVKIGQENWGSACI